MNILRSMESARHNIPAIDYADQSPGRAAGFGGTR
jgi:hypothetical protein